MIPIRQKSVLRLDNTSPPFPVIKWCVSSLAIIIRTFNGSLDFVERKRSSCYNYNEDYLGGVRLAKKRKQQFSVGTEESIADCLDHMKKEGYRPVRRMEKPVFKENGSKTPVISHQQIIFEGILEEDEQ